MRLGSPVENNAGHVADIDTAVVKSLALIHRGARLLTMMSGLSDVSAQVIVAEIGVDMSRFPSDAHLATRKCSAVARG
jgi:transposase